MEKPKKHIFVCCSFRTSGEPKGVCNKKDAPALVQYLDTEVNDRGMNDVMVSTTGCLKVCEKGPIMVVYPEGVWYGNVDEGAVDEILDAMENGEIAEKFVIMK
ncbi:MAG TPA: ferredoxin [Spirochaetia bacterium]|nr:MAG: ferredoxin [Spirochaetes bacterium GWB1_36_13]HCL56207.1 ferredoxin [Spirochaetia bacterium]